MARLIGYMANRADRLRDAFHQERHAIAGLPADQRGAWGIGFYQGDEVLHKKQPTPDGESSDGDPTQDGEALMSLGTDDGRVLLFNCHVSASRARKVE